MPFFKLCAIRSLRFIDEFLYNTHIYFFNMFHSKILYLTLADTRKNPVPERSGSTSEELRENPMQRSTETENLKKMDAKKYKAIFCMTLKLLQEFREKLVDESSPSGPRGNPERGYRGTSSSSHELTMEPRAKVELGSGKQSVYTHFPKGRNCDVCLRTKITRASCRRHAGTVVTRGKFW